jgi:hypothetical protein
VTVAVLPEIDFVGVPTKCGLPAYATCETTNRVNKVIPRTPPTRLRIAFSFPFDEERSMAMKRRPGRSFTSSEGSWPIGLPLLPYPAYSTVARRVKAWSGDCFTSVAADGIGAAGRACGDEKAVGMRI